MRAQGGHGHPPFYLTCGICDYAAAFLTAYGVTAALYARKRTGKGQRVETSLLNASMAVQPGNFIFYDGRPDIENGAPDLWGSGALHRIYPTANNSLSLAIIEGTHWQALCQVLAQAKLDRLYTFRCGTAGKGRRFSCCASCRNLRDQNDGRMVGLTRQGRRSLRTDFAASSALQR